MKKVFFFELLVLSCILSATAQHRYEVLPDSVNIGQNILKGELTKSDFAGNPNIPGMLKARRFIRFQMPLL